MRKKLRVLFILSFVFMLIIVGCSQEETETEESREIPVRVEKVKFGELSGSNILNGTVIADEEVEIMPKSIGEINKINVKKGDIVSKGDVLAELDNTEERNALEQQKAALKQAEAGLKGAKEGKKTAEANVEQSRKALKQAEASLSEAKRSSNNSGSEVNFSELALKQAEEQYSQLSQMHKEGLVSDSEYEKAKNEFKETTEQITSQAAQTNPGNGLQSLEGSVEQARSGFEMAQASVGETDVAIDQAQAGVDQARLGVESAEDRVNDTLIKSPISGEVVELNNQVGEIASQQAPFATIASTDKVKVIVNVLPEMLDAFEVDKKIDVNAGIDSEKYEATISYVASVSSGSGLFPVEAELSSKDKQIKPGMVVTVELEEVLVPESVLVPTDAIIQQEGLDVVFIVEEDVAIRKEVEVIKYGSELTAVKGDLKENDLIVTSGQNLLEDESTVKIMEED